MNQKRLDRINELARKQKAEGLTEQEKAEQKVLRQEYLADFRKNLRGQLENITFVDKAHLVNTPRTLKFSVSWTSPGVHSGQTPEDHRLVHE